MESTGITPVMNMGGHDYGFGGGSGLWLFAILALMWGGNGFFGNRNAYPQDYARQSDVVYTSAFNQLQDENRALNAEIQRTAYDTVANLKDGQYNNLSEIRDLQALTSAGFASMQKCCCDTEKAILESRYLNEKAIAESNAYLTAQIGALSTKLDQNKIEALQARVNELQLNQALCGVVRYPNTMAYNAGTSPFCGCGGCGNI